MHTRSLLCCLFWFAGCGFLSAAETVPPSASASPVFEADVRPILKAHCWHCHGEADHVEGGLDTRLARWLHEGGDSGAAIEPGDHESSLLYQRIADGDMPPGEKQLTAAELETIAAWIDSGATTARPEPETFTEAALFTEEERSHWAFQPIARPEIPATEHPELLSTPIDAFLLARLETEQLSFAPEADRATLVRRLYFDLVGLPPEPDELARIMADNSPDWYEQLVDRLLASPAYGERWGRHWLDVAGYADSDGYTSKDIPRPWAWRYRDYVIRAMNADRSWRELIVEQLAGDELSEPPYKNLTPEQAEALIGTGFLRMAPDGTGDSAADKNTAINDVLAETVKIASTAMLGLTVGCAQCHDHRYDPISQKDYHRFRALFEPAFDAKNWRTANARLISLWSDETRARAAEVAKELKAVNEQRSQELDKIVAETFERELAKLPEELQADARLARETDPKERTDAQQKLIKEYPFLNVNPRTVYLYLPDRLRGFNKKWDERRAEVESRRPEEDLVHCLTEVPNQVPKSFVFVRGDFNQPSDEVVPGPLTVLGREEVSIPVDDPELPTTGRRLAYAQYLTDGRHPLVARVLMNRFWMHHFGRGIVATPGDFGVLGEPPSHPELLDYLADEFMRRDWRLKPLQRMMVLSTAYRQTSRHRAEHDAVDPDNRLLGRMPVRRLEAEAIRDAVLSASGQLVHQVYGKPSPVAPDEVGQIVVAVDTRDSAGRPTGKHVDIGGDEFRRSVYVEVRRTMPLGVLEPFDAPVMAPNCELRVSSTVAPQSLLMMNSPFLVAQAAKMAERVVREAGSEPEAQLRAAWRLAYAREPSPEEVASGVQFLGGGDAGESAAAAEAEGKAASLSLTNLCQALLCSTRFLYIE
ncbi:DUF1553 domain-containing protein [Candidatus Laterigemmans baculatus]|uniref:DUF1553 domain-containing protein n=1 Tax=Candidatus Laterigemmans baculatus TaxID=2770505 RepID=UPI0013DCEBA2|nr:DUF1553 domain-containing protein [Candidatus Laterigemmans baculatus]